MHINQVHCVYKNGPKTVQRILKISSNSQFLRILKQNVTNSRSMRDIVHNNVALFYDIY